MNTYSVSVDSCWTFTRCMSWSTIETCQSTRGKIQSTRGKIPPCRTGLLLRDGGIVVCNSLGLTRRRLSSTTGLHHVHPTGAGTFVLAALVAVFAGLNFVLLDSDWLPVTLCEVEDLWTEAFLARFPADLWLLSLTLSLMLD